MYISSSRRRLDNILSLKRALGRPAPPYTTKATPREIRPYADQSVPIALSRPVSDAEKDEEEATTRKGGLE